MIDYTDCTKEELIELLEQYANKWIVYVGHLIAFTPTEEEIYSMLKRDGLKVKYVESEDE